MENIDLTQSQAKYQDQLEADIFLRVNDFFQRGDWPKKILLLETQKKLLPTVLQEQGYTNFINGRIYFEFIKKYD